MTALFGAGKIDWLKSDHAQVVIIVLFLWKKLRTAFDNPDY